MSDSGFPSPYEVPAAPPGSVASPHTGRTELAAASLAAVGGLLVFAALMVAVWASVGADVARMDDNHDSASELRQVRDILVALGIILAALPLTAAAGLVAGLAWARPFAYLAAAVSVALVPVGTIPGIVALVALAKGAGR